MQRRCALGFAAAALFGLLGCGQPFTAGGAGRGGTGNASATGGGTSSHGGSGGAGNSEAGATSVGGGGGTGEGGKGGTTSAGGGGGGGSGSTGGPCANAHTCGGGEICCWSELQGAGQCAAQDSCGVIDSGVPLLCDADTACPNGACCNVLSPKRAVMCNNFCTGDAVVCDPNDTEGNPCSSCCGAYGEVGLCSTNNLC
jgi:hypothetical protein